MICWIKLNNAISEEPAYLPMGEGRQQIHSSDQFKKSFAKPSQGDCVVLYQTINGIHKVVSHLLRFYDGAIYRTTTYADYPWTRNVKVIMQLDLDTTIENPITIEKLLGLDEQINVRGGFVTLPSTYNARLTEQGFRKNISTLLTPDNGYIKSP